jgi:hypothetical protein
MCPSRPERTDPAETTGRRMPQARRWLTAGVLAEGVLDSTSYSFSRCQRLEIPIIIHGRGRRYLSRRIARMSDVTRIDAALNPISQNRANHLIANDGWQTDLALISMLRQKEKEIGIDDLRIDIMKSSIDLYNKISVEHFNITTNLLIDVVCGNADYYYIDKEPSYMFSVEIRSGVIYKVKDSRRDMAIQFAIVALALATANVYDQHGAIVIAEVATIGLAIASAFSTLYGYYHKLDSDDDRKVYQTVADLQRVFLNEFDSRQKKYRPPSINEIKNRLANSMSSEEILSRLAYLKSKDIIEEKDGGWSPTF